ncbi:MAG: phosphatase PAP2 family protein [Roseburia sp.]|uniref:phosphatase PAP2 family protein n=1 Tax=Roseburia sp. 831b TaxID=1261635 RepID=UPI00095216D9|nr:phosphatase PAP2 family protein [Roseburia sp. 831b]MDD6216833.1 phosphatase PAP2 family protein [Roseburia sp.]WVK73127.1 phosphatase PAP2 family protein [Roseburia sp. 831b]
MTKEQYRKLTEFLRKDDKKKNAVVLLNRILTTIVFVTYPLYLLFLLWKKEVWLARAIIVPLDSFLVVSFVRYLINAKRPYEKFDLPPVLEKDTKGKSFPSRHVFSVFIIAMTVFYTFPWAGIVLMVIGVLLGAIRVVGGVHEPKDVAAGALVGVLCGLIGYYWI